MTLPDAHVVEFINGNFIPIRVHVGSDQDLPMEFGIKYTPTFVIADEEGKEHQRVVGFQRPSELIPFLILGLAKSHFNRGAFAKAKERLEDLLREYPESQPADEASILKRDCENKLAAA